MSVTIGQAGSWKTQFFFTKLQVRGIIALVRVHLRSCYVRLFARYSNTYFNDSELTTKKWPHVDLHPHLTQPTNLEDVEA